MIDTTYAVNCLKQGFKRYVRCNRINATIDCGDNYVSFYVKDFKGKQYLARSSNHHLKMQHLANKDEPWKGDNISIVFITPNSPQDTRIRGRVRQTHYGSIKPFSVTTYQYDNTILDEMDLRQIFYAIMSFLNGNGYKDPLAKTPKAAKVIPRNANIKSYKEPSPARNISVDRNGNYVSANAWGADYVTEDNNRNNTYYNMKRIIRLTESDLHNIVKESVNRILRESKYDYYDSSPYDEYNEFDRNMNDEIESDCYEAKFKLTKGDYSKNTINTLLNGIKEGDEEAIDAYYYAKRNGVCPIFVKQAENIMSWSEIYDTHNPRRGDSLGTDFDGKTRLGSSFSNAALNGVNYVRGNIKPDFEKIYGGSPKNDINLNIYNRNGKLGMAALSPDTEEGSLARLARPTIRATYNAAKDYQKSRNESD